MSPSVKDIARICGVSPSTVSYALNNGPRSVGQALREKILSVAAELEYRPNHLARAMVTGRSHSIGVVPGRIGPQMLGYPFIQAAMVGLSEAAVEVKHDLLLYAHSESISEAELRMTLMDRKADGFVMIAPDGIEPVIRTLVQSKIPVVTIAGDPSTGAPVFASDNGCGIGLAVSHVASLGHERIAFIGGSMSMLDGRERTKAFVDSMKSRKLHMRPEWITNGEFTMPFGRDAAAKLLSHGELPTAIICGNDEIALGVYDTARELGLNIPDDLSIVGFDDAPSARLVHPGLTTVHQATEAIAGEAMRCLIRLIEGKSVPHMVRFPTSLVIRQSTCPVRKRRRVRVARPSPDT